MRGMNFREAFLIDSIAEAGKRLEADTITVQELTDKATSGAAKEYEQFWGKLVLLGDKEVLDSLIGERQFRLKFLGYVTAGSAVLGLVAGLLR